MGNKFEGIIIASDLDGTYFGDGTVLVERNIERVRYFCENGGHFTFATGRLPIFMRKPMPNIKELINAPAVTGNGTCLYDFEHEKALEEHFLEYEDILEFVEYISSISSNVGFRGTFDKGFVVPNIENQYSRAEYYYFPDFMDKRILGVNEWNNFNLYKVNVMDTPEFLQRLYPMLQARFSDKVTVSRAGTTMIEIMPKGTSKAVMLQKLVKERFAGGTTLYTVGDYDNDLEMHSIADYPVCPSNANDNVKKICKRQLCSNNEGVVADLIDMLDAQA